MNKLEDYLGVKLISACPMNLGDYNKFKGWKITDNEDPTKLGYLVKYNPEYISWSPKEVFEKAYRPTNGLNFGLALEALKLGKKITRAGWNGKGMFLWLKPQNIVESSWCKDPMLKEISDNNGGSILALGTICMYTHDSTGRKAILTGWLASQSDMLADDWQIIY